MRGSGQFAECGDAGTGLLKFRFGKFYLARKSVQMTHRSAQDFFETRILRTLQFFQYRFGDVLLIFDNHNDVPAVVLLTSYFSATGTANRGLIFSCLIFFTPAHFFQLMGRYEIPLLV
jgi:hypothetical protein